MRDIGVGSWIHRRRVKSATRLALVTDSGVVTFGDLATRIDRLADALETRGTSRGDRVGFIGPNSAEFVEAMFATLSLGAIFVPLNTRLASSEIAYMVNDAGIGVVFAAPECVPLLAGTSADVIAVGAPYEALVAGGSAEHRTREVALDDSALILYTSGTTGRPKGAVLTHGNLTWNCVNVLVDYDVTSSEVALMISPLFHVAALGMGALPTLLKGGTVVLQSRFVAAEALAAIERYSVTSLSGVPTTFQLIAEDARWEHTDLTSLRKLTCGGSPVPPAVAESYGRRGLAFSGGYGMTESSPGVTSLSPEAASTRPSSVGLPHFFTDIRIVPDAEAGVDSGYGEILVAGDNVFGGYWGLPDAAESVFDGRWFRSGDLGTIDEDGYVYVTGRVKDMIISGGENIYPAELEHLLRAHDAVDDVAVIGVPDAKWGEVGVAIVRAADGRGRDPQDILSVLDGLVARYKIPKAVVFVEELPKTATGKIKKAELRELYGRGGIW